MEVTSKNTDILHIKAGIDPSSATGRAIIEQWWYWILYAALLIALIAVVAAYHRNIARSADIRGMKLAKANKVARKRLRQARAYMQQKDSEKFYEELLRAVWGYLSDKLSIPSSQLSRDNISAELLGFGASQETTDTIISVLDDCEMARYSPVSSQDQIELLYDKAASSINSLENLKRNK